MARDEADRPSAEEGADTGERRVGACCAPLGGENEGGEGRVPFLDRGRLDGKAGRHPGHGGPGAGVRTAGRATRWARASG